MNEMQAWVMLGVNVMVMAIGFNTTRRENRKEAEERIKAAVSNEARLSRIEGKIRNIMIRLNVMDYDEGQKE